MFSPHVSIVIPQSGHSPLTIAAIRSLQRFHNDLPEILVIDDGSATGERRILQAAALPRTEVLASDRRRGVTAVWNLGWRAVRGEIVVFLNNDTLSTGEWLPLLTAPLQSSCILMTGTTFRQESQPISIRRRVVTPRFLEGWCFAVRRCDLVRFDGFDDRLRLYFSDTDLQCRLQMSADVPELALHAVPGLPLIHLRHRTTRGLADRDRQWRVDRDRFVQKWRNAALPSDRH